MAARPESEILTRKNVEAAFKSFDLDQDGFIVLEDIKKMMNGIVIEEAQWMRLFSEVDVGGDGKVCSLVVSTTNL